MEYPSLQRAPCPASSVLFNSSSGPILAQKLSEFLQAARSRRSNAGNGHSQTLGHGGIAELGWVEVKQIDQQAASLRKIEHRAFDDMLVFDPPNVSFDAGILTVERDRRLARFPHRSGLPPRYGH